MNAAPSAHDNVSGSGSVSAATGVPGDIVVTQPAPGVVLITLHRPEARNALRTQTLREIANELTLAATDDTRRVVVLTGSLDYFAAGADIREMAPLGPVEILAHERGRHWRTIQTFAKPMIAAVNGYALGGGCELALCADLICAGSNARFGQPEINLGMIPGAGGTQRLTRFVGKAKAMDMVLTSRMMDATEAERCGLVSRVVPLARLMDEALAAALTICEFSQIAVMAAKESVNRAFESPLSDGVLFERRMFHAMFATGDQKEGMDAFVNKRKAEFKHR